MGRLTVAFLAHSIHNDSVIMGPDRSVVIAHRIEGCLELRQGSNTPGCQHIGLHQPFDNALLLPVRKDSGSQKVTWITGNNVAVPVVYIQGDGRKVNSSAIGARVRIKLAATGSGSASRTLTRQVEGGGVGQGNQNDLTLHFGLGSHASEVQYTVTWTNGEKQTGTTPVDRMIRVEMTGTE